ncbi:MAG: 8-oxo-dGTP pyrophosphatase MutT (NUDIX family) [Myxococcota bacterium]
MKPELAFDPPDLTPTLSLLEAHFASARGRAPAPIRNYHRETPVTAAVRAEAKASAVLVPIVIRDGALCVLLTRRHHDISYPGQLCFPGGRTDPEDADATATALRESREEINLTADRVRVLGGLGDYFTQSGYRIKPIVGIVTPPLDLKLSPREVVEVLEVPLAALTSAASYRIWRSVPEKDQAYYAFQHGQARLTGPTVCLAMGFYEALVETFRSGAGAR